MSVLLTSPIYIDSVLTPVGTTVSLGYQREQAIVSAGEGTWVTIPTIPLPSPSAPTYPYIVDARAFGVEADGKIVYDATTTASATCTITSATANFTPNDVGKACTVLSYADSANTVRYGTISSVAANGLSCVAALNSSPGALTAVTFSYASDDGAALNAAFAAAAATRSTVVLPLGVIGSTIPLVIPDGATVRGQGRTITGNYAKNFRHIGTTLICLKSLGAALGFLTVGDNASSGIYGSLLLDCNVDGMLQCGSVILLNGKVGSLERVTAIRSNLVGVNECVVRFTNGGGKMINCIAIGQEQGHVVAVSGDGKCLNNQIFGAGNGYYGIKCSGCDDVLIAYNHIWKDGSNPAMLGGSIYIDNYGGDTLKGGITIQGNKFDTAFGPHILITTLGTGSVIRGISILDNISMNSANVPANTYPWIQITVPALGIVRGLVIKDNLIRGSFSDPTVGGHKYFIDASACAGNIYGSIVADNFIDNLGTSGIVFSATWTAVDKGLNSNLYMQTGSTTVTAF